MLLTSRVTQLPRIKHIANNPTVASHDKINHREQLALFGKMVLQFRFSHQQRGYVRVFVVQHPGYPFLICRHRVNPALRAQIFDSLCQAAQIRLLHNRFGAGLPEVLQSRQQTGCRTILASEPQQAVDVGLYGTGEA